MKTIFITIMLVLMGCGQAYDYPVNFEDQPKVGGVLPDGFGLSAKEYSIVPNNRIHEMNVVSNGFSSDELSVMDKSMEIAATLSSFEVMDGDEVSIIADINPALDTCKGVSEGTCWFGSSSCIRMSQPDKDNIIVCNKYNISIAVENVRAWANSAGVQETQAMTTIVTHETLHTMGLHHSHDGVMMAGIPIKMLKDSSTVYISQCETMRLNAFETDDSGVWNHINACQ